MLVSKSKEMMRKSFEKTLYRFMEIPKPGFRGGFGIYIHIPFCVSKCSFCPFYKELFSQRQKRQYLGAIVKEIEGTDMQGRAKWLYIGGGTPNLLETGEIQSIIEEIGRKVKIDNAGIELLPALANSEYLQGLKRIGFTKISLGVESLNDEVLAKTGRKNTTYSHIRGLIESAKSLELWVNVDMMVGLPGQNRDTFKDEIKKISILRPDQITIYPFMVIRGLQAASYMLPKMQFALIEEAAKILAGAGYKRKGVWSFANGEDFYDSSRDELVEDYAGFGASAFSTYGNWKVVNPELDVYMHNMETGKRMGFVAAKKKATNEWRKFARMIYDLKCDNFRDFPFYIRLFNWILTLAGYSRNGLLTEKGKIFAHEISKTVVESLPFPIQNPACVENYNEYTS